MKAAYPFPLNLALAARPTGTPAYRWLYETLRSRILQGDLRPGTRLPATRDLARQQGLARGTVVNAFELLRSEGYVTGNVGSGTYVSRVLPEEWLRVRPEPASDSKARRRKTALSHYGRRARLFPGFEERPIRAFRSNLPALDLFPVALWTKLTVRSLRRISRASLMGCQAAGYRPLRQALAEYLITSRGVKCKWEQVVILSGVQEAIDTVARLLLNEADAVCVESPGYPGASSVFEAIGAKVHAAPVDNDGVRVDELGGRRVRLLYVTPGHQFPLGTTMSLSRRLQVLEWARKSGAMIFEDDYDSEYRYSGRPIPAMQGLDRHGLVLYAGSFSKVLFPALRVGYLVVPEDLVERVEAIKSLTTRHAPMLEQLVLHEFVAEGHFARHLRRMREVYAGRLALLVEEAQAQLLGLLEVSTVEAGLQTVGWLARGIRGEKARVMAWKRGVDVTPVSQYASERKAREGLVMGFAAIDAAEIRRGVRELAVALESARK